MKTIDSFIDGFQKLESKIVNKIKYPPNTGTILWLFHVWSWILLIIVKTNVGQIFDFLIITRPYKCSKKIIIIIYQNKVFQFLIIVVKASPPNYPINPSTTIWQRDCQWCPPSQPFYHQVLVNLGLWGFFLQEQCALCHRHQESHYDKCFACVITQSLLSLSFFIIFFKCNAIINILVTNTCCSSCCNQSIATITKAPWSSLTIASSYCIDLGPLHHNGTTLPCSN